MSDKKVMLIILDGWGLSGSEMGNAPFQAKTPTLDSVYQRYPKTSLSASGIEVGLTPGEPGNSEVGHMNIGTGRVVWESLPRIDQDIENKTLDENEVLAKSAEYSKKNDKTVHLVGLVSDGGVHSHIRHLIALCRILSQRGVARLRIHFISDGRDTEARAAEKYLNQIEAELSALEDCKIATMIGRFFAMDRDKNWERIRAATELFFDNTGKQYLTAEEAIRANYAEKHDDENMDASVIGEGAKIESGDSVLLFNFRADRAKQLLSAFCGKVDGIIPPKDLNLVTMTQYQKDQTVPMVFPAIDLDNTLPEVVAAENLSQFHTAETEKFAHVTYFFNAGKEMGQKGEDDELVPSKKVASYAKSPEMSAKEITAKVIGAIKKNENLIVVNYANGDMVGHTGDDRAAILACEEVDKNLAQVFAEASVAGYKVILTADHGNCELMINEQTKSPNKEHTTNSVPFVYLDFLKRPFEMSESEFTKDEYIQYCMGTPIGVLADIAPSVLANLGVKQPADMSGMDLTTAMI
ncbi:MAG: 2,3-bisphosphoglycerate-independent phosphoglycerate mutase [Candidatus Berkelbacteria bacterium]